MSREYRRVTLSGRIEFAEDFATRATLERGVPIDLDEPITEQDDPLLVALLARQRARDEEKMLRYYAETQGMVLYTF